MSVQQRSESILLVDDDDLHVRALTRQLRALGYRYVFRAASAAQARQMLEHVRPTVVLTDMSMEAADSGTAVVEAARAAGASVAVLSGQSDIDALSLGVPVFKKGSLDAVALSSLLASLIDQSRHQSGCPASSEASVA